jgi:hypothetical protein
VILSPPYMAGPYYAIMAARRTTSRSAGLAGRPLRRIYLTGLSMGGMGHIIEGLQFSGARLANYSVVAAAIMRSQVRFSMYEDSSWVLAGSTRYVGISPGRDNSSLYS